MEVQNVEIRQRKPTEEEGQNGRSYAESRQVVLHHDKRTSPFFSIKKGLIALTSIGLGLFSWMNMGQRPIDPLDYKARTDHVMKTTPLIDGHNDLPYLTRLELKNKIYDRRFTFREGLACHTDLKRMKDGRVGGQFWSVYVECPDIVHLDDPNHNVRDTLEQIDVAKRIFNEYPELHYCETSSCAHKAFKSGRIASMLGAEGLHQAGSAIAVIRQFWDLGVRYITFTHNCDNPFATAASTVTETGKDGGLTEFGRAAVQEMNRLGMMVDLSHVSHRTMRDVLDITTSPVIFSHTGCYSIVNNYRNAPDDVIVRLKENGGVMMVYFVNRFIKANNPSEATPEDAVDCIFHAVELAGWDHVGIGADFDGTRELPNGIRGVSDYPYLVETMMQRGATDDQVRKFLGENILRAWHQNEINAVKLQKVMGKKPVEEVWEGRRWGRWNNGLPVMIPGNKDRIRGKDYI
ncbi:MAG: hypothetical protein M1834_009205 [Cirrosporium novae-zelandiae]|nr:MAG: hypothetical protein M1834_009205 [Cirrosporium novae-zelandiae]